MNGSAEGEQYGNPGLTGVSFSTIMVILLSIVMAGCIAAVPMFSGNYYDVVTFGLKCRIANYSAGLSPFFVILTLIPFGLSLLTILLTIVGAVTRNYSLQNGAAAFNLVLLAPPVIYSISAYGMFLGVGFWCYLLCGVAVLYFTQRVSDSKNPLGLAGTIGIIVGAVVGALGYYTAAFPKVDLSAASSEVAGFTIVDGMIKAGSSVTVDYVPALTPLMIAGIIVAIIGGFLMVLGFENEMTEKKITYVRRADSIA